MHSLHAKNALLLALLLAAGLPYGERAVVSIALGGGMQAVNLGMLERSVSILLGLARERHGRGVQALLGLRLVLLFSLVGVIFATQPIDPLGFTLGLSTVVPAVIWHGLATPRREA